MYIPEHFRLRHDADAVAFMRANPFAILISTTDDGPFATHLPLFVQAEEGKALLHGHVAKANPHWRYLEQESAMLDDFSWPALLHLPGQLRRARKRSHMELCRGTCLR